MFAVILSAASDGVHRYVKMRRSWALALVVVLILAGIGGLLYLFGAQTAIQIEELTKTLPNGVAKLRSLVAQYSWGQRAVDSLQKINIASASGDVLTHALGAVSSALGVITDFILIFFSGLYLAVQPDLYLRGVLSLTPPSYRGRMAEILAGLYDALRGMAFRSAGSQWWSSASLSASRSASSACLHRSFWA